MLREVSTAAGVLVNLYGFAVDDAVDAVTWVAYDPHGHRLAHDDMDSYLAALAFFAEPFPVIALI